MKKFVAISTQNLNNKLVLINTSAGYCLKNELGISHLKAIEFLYGLRSKFTSKKQRCVFVTFAASKDFEFIFSSLQTSDKDKIFQSHKIKKELAKLDNEQEILDEQFYNLPKDSQEFELTDFERYVNQLARAELVETKIDDYVILLANGKRLTIRKNNKAINIYDIYGFFQKPLSYVSAHWANSLKDALINAQKFCDNSLTVDTLHAYSDIETQVISAVASSLNDELNKYGFNLSRYHGATAITSKVLTNYSAKKYFHNYKQKRQYSPQLFQACFSAYYGGRAEQLKIGTVQNVNVYDINSAYAYASLFLPVMLRKPRFSKHWKPEKFSLWFCEFDFSNINPYFGYLPFRQQNKTLWKQKGRGYYWQPEVSFLLKHFPQCVNVKHGYYLDYRIAPFTQGILELHELRKQLQAQNNPLEKVIKLALVSFYGKFCQHNGKGYYYNMFYAGFLTSFVRTMLLTATKGFERETISFNTDAIHTTAKLDLPISNEIGEYKLEQFEKVSYIESGIYQGYNSDKITKTKSKGTRYFDFESALNNLNDSRKYNALVEFFIGHNVYSANCLKHADYLQNYKTDKINSPTETTARLFDAFNCDLKIGFIDSRINNFDNGLISEMYRPYDLKDSDIALDTVEARSL